MRFLACILRDCRHCLHVLSSASQFGFEVETALACETALVRGRWTPALWNHCRTCAIVRVNILSRSTISADHLSFGKCTSDASTFLSWFCHLKTEGSRWGRLVFQLEQVAVGMAVVKEYLGYWTWFGNSPLIYRLNNFIHLIFLHSFIHSFIHSFASHIDLFVPDLRILIQRHPSVSSSELSSGSPSAPWLTKQPWFGYFGASWAVPLHKEFCKAFQGPIRTLSWPKYSVLRGTVHVLSENSNRFIMVHWK